MRSVKSTSTLNTKIENRRTKLSQNQPITSSNSKKDLIQQNQYMSNDRNKNDENLNSNVKPVKNKSQSSAKKSDEFFNNLSLRGMPGINTTALNQQAMERLNKEREDKKLSSQRKLKKMKNTTSTQDL